jgi:O-Antigen ligase
MPGDLGDRVATPTVVPMALLLCALTYGAEAQGAFYPGPFHVFVVLIAVAVVASVPATRSRPWTSRILTDPLVVLGAVLALVTVTSSAVAGHPANAVGPGSLLLAMAGAIAVVKALRPEERRLLMAGIVVMAVVVAVVGWVAVVARRPPEALTGQGLWRAASTLTYENALAAFLTMPALFCFDRLMTSRDRRLAWSEGAYVLLVGLGASLSRGGVLGLLIGIAVLAVLRRPRTLLRLGPAVIGSLVALACLAPSVPVDSSMHVFLAVAGMVFGGAVAAWTVGTTRLRIGAAAAGIAVLAVLVVVVSSRHVAGEIARARLSAGSSDRAHEWAAAFAVARHHLLLGVGTARVLLQWQVDGKTFTAVFAHNEFLQLLTQDGIIGLGVLVVGLALVFRRLAVSRRLARRRRQADVLSAECGIACLVALLVQSCLDFLWHIPVIPVLLAVVLAAATAVAPGDEPRHGSPSVVPTFVRRPDGDASGLRQMAGPGD